MKKMCIRDREYLGYVNGQVEEVYGGHNIVKAFNKEDDVIGEFDRDNDRLYRSAWKSQFLSGMMMPIMQFVGNLGYVAVVILGGYLAIKKTIEVGDIQSFIQYVRNFTQPIQQVAQVANMLQSTACLLYTSHGTFKIFGFFGAHTVSATHTSSWHISLPPSLLLLIHSPTTGTLQSDSRHHKFSEALHAFLFQRSYRHPKQ